MRINDRGTKAPLTSIPTSSVTTFISIQERNPPFTDKKEASYAFRLPPSLCTQANVTPTLPSPANSITT
jgi:hypothetical protein